MRVFVEFLAERAGNDDLDCKPLIFNDYLITQTGDVTPTCNTGSNAILASRQRWFKLQFSPTAPFPGPQSTEGRYDSSDRESGSETTHLPVERCITTARGNRLLLFLDTEFTSLSSPRLLSIGLVTDTGLRFYGELTGVPRGVCSDFVRAEVLPLLRLIPPTAEGPAHVVAKALTEWLATLGPVNLVFDFFGDLELLDNLLGGRHPSIAAVLDAGPMTSQPAFAEAQDRAWRSHANMRHHALIDAMALAAGWHALTKPGIQQNP